MAVFSGHVRYSPDRVVHRRSTLAYESWLFAGEINVRLPRTGAVEAAVSKKRTDVR